MAERVSEYERKRYVVYLSICDDNNKIIESIL